MNILFYLFIVVCNSSASVFSKKNAARGGKTSVFNATRAVVPLLLFGIIALASGESVTAKTALFGVLYGLALAGSTICGYLALSLGPMGVTSALVNFSLVPVTLWCVLVKGEALTAFKVVGVCLALVALVVMNVEKSHGSFDKKKWLFLTFSTLALNAAGQILVVSCEADAGGLGFTALSQVVPTVAFGTFFLVENRNKKSETASAAIEPKQNGTKTVVYGALAGTATACNSLFTFILSSKESGTILFPLVSALNIVTVFLLGILLFKEKPNAKRIVAVVLAAISVALLKAA